MPGHPFDIDLPATTPLSRAVAMAARPFLNWTLGTKKLRELYDRANAPRVAMAAQAADENGDLDFAAAALDVLEIALDCDGVGQIPSRGPLIVAANHPHGALDGLALLHVISRVRSDVRLVANHLVRSVPELTNLCFFVDPFEGARSRQRSLAGLRSACCWLRCGGAVVIFPSGEVAHVRRAPGSPVDSHWRSTIGRLALSTGAQVLPVHIAGRNSRLFYVAGRVHPRLRTLLLPRELLNRRGATVRVTIGRALSATELTADGSGPDAVTDRIRQAVEAASLAQPVDRATLDTEVRQLPAEARLISAGAMQVYCAEAALIPHLLQEIGRLREVSFRAVGEGTGTRSDIDAFDHRYVHLFLWNQRSREVVGAYRIGRTDLIVGTAGVEGLYTRTLFRYDEHLLARLPPALELGRSFVRPEYQRDHSALLLLWRGICAFVGRHPHYRVLFGAVSISARYSDRTRDMLMRFLEQNHLEPLLAKQVSSLRPDPRASALRPAVTAIPRTIAEADALASQLESDCRGMPVLLRQYLKLNAKLLGFNVDPSFGDALDALMMVDLTQVDKRLLRKYFGAAAAREFLQAHLAESASDAA